MCLASQEFIGNVARPSELPSFQERPRSGGAIMTTLWQGPEDSGGEAGAARRTDTREIERQGRIGAFFSVARFTRHTRPCLAGGTGPGQTWGAMPAGKRGPGNHLYPARLGRAPDMNLKSLPQLSDR